MKQITCDDLIAFEAEIATEFNSGHIRAPVHLFVGAALLAWMLYVMVDGP